MARDNDFNRTEARKKTGDRLYKSISLASIVSSVGILYQVDARIQKTIDSRIELIKPTNDQIRAVCKEIVDIEKERAHEREEELRNSIDFIMRYYKR